MTARLTINPRPPAIPAEVTESVHQGLTATRPPLFQMPCPHHLSDEISTFLQRLPRLPLPSLKSCKTPARQNESPAPSCSQPRCSARVALWGHMPGPVWFSSILQPVMLGIIFQSPFCSPTQNLTKGLVVASRYSKIPSTELLEWITDSASVPSDGNFTGCTVYAPASLIPQASPVRALVKRHSTEPESSPALGPILQPCLVTCVRPFTHPVWASMSSFDKLEWLPFSALAHFHKGTRKVKEPHHSLMKGNREEHKLKWKKNVALDLFLFQKFQKWHLACISRRTSSQYKLYLGGLSRTRWRGNLFWTDFCTNYLNTHLYACCNRLPWTPNSGKIQRVSGHCFCTAIPLTIPEYPHLTRLQITAYK